MSVRRQRWTRAAVIAVCSLGVIGLLVATLGVVRGDSSAQPSECTGSANASQSVECKQALLTEALDAAAPSELDDVDAEKRIDVATALCEQGKELTAATAARPLRQSIYAGVAKEQGVNESAVAAIAANLDQLCKREAGMVEGLPQSQGSFSAQLQIDGSGPISVRYTNSDGTEAKEDGFAPWSLPITLQAPVAIHLEASSRKIDGPDAPPADDLRCSVTVGSKVLVQNGPSAKGGSIQCDVTTEELMNAANAPSTGG